MTTPSYNAQMALEAVSGQDTSSHTYLASASYDASGRVLERRLGAGGNLSVRYSYYPWTQQGGRLQQLAAGPLANPSALLDLRYTYSVNTGNLTSIQDYKLGSPQTQSFQYDDLDRLTQAGASGGTVGNYGPESYTYSATTGNLASSNGTVYTYTNPAHVHAVTSLANATNDHFAYDANGNMTSRTVGGQSFALSYDAENRLVGVNWTISQTAHTAAFLYNDDGKRIVSTIDGTTTVFAGDGFEWHGDAASSVKYYFAGSVRLAMRTGSGEPLFLLGDHLGSTSVVADGTGQQVGGSPQAYEAWGETRAGNVPTGYRFTGQYSNEAGFGLYYYGARWLDPGLKRWASPDSTVPLASQGVQALDRYAFTNNNPLRYVDPSGHDIWDVIHQVSTGFVKEFALRNVAWVSPQAQADLSVKSSETTAALAGRIAADAATIILGIDNMTAGATIATGGSAIACGTTLCLGVAATVTAGTVVATVGVAQTAQGAMGLGGNLALLSGSRSASDIGSGGSLAIQTLQDLSGKSQAEVSDILNKAGFKYVKTTEGGYQLYTHSDGSAIWIGPDGRIVRLGPKVWDTAGTQKYNPRYDQNGNLTQDHDTGEYIAK